MLVLSRRVEEGLLIGEEIEVRVLNVYSTDDSGLRKAKVASIGIQAPREISILRGELVKTVEENRQAVESARRVTPDGLSELLRQKRKDSGQETEL